MYTARSGQMLDMANLEPCFVTTNSFIKKSGSLVMGRGAAAAATRIWPACDLYFGSLVPHMGKYNILYDPARKLGLFQVKYFWGDDASLDLIRDSARALANWTDDNPGPVHLNYPGIGFGRLKKSDVDPLLECLPPQVHVWTFSGPSLAKF